MGDGFFWGSTDTHLYAINPDGSLKWDFETDEQIYWSYPAINSDGTIYIGTKNNDNNYLYAITSSSKGLANSPWPKLHHDNQNTGNFLYSSSTAQCDSNHLDLCTTESKCEDAEGYWYNSKCNFKPQTTSGTGVTTSNANPTEAMDVVEYTSGITQPNPLNTIVNVAASSSVYLQPSLKVASNDVGKSATLVMYIYISSIHYGFMLPTKNVTLESEQKFLNLPKTLDFSDAEGMTFDVYYGYRIGTTLKYNSYEVKIK